MILKLIIQYFCGLQLNVHEFYEKSDLFLVTSYNETFCLSLCEAMYHRLVCIAGNVGGPSEIVLPISMMAI